MPMISPSHVRRTILSISYVTLMFVGALAAQAGDLIIGVGRDNVDSSDASEATGVQVEYHSAPIRSYDWGDISWMGVIEGDSDSDLYAGAGFSLIWVFSQSWFVEGSLAAGYYDAGSDGLDLGGDFQFRTLAGIGYRLNEVSAVSFSIDHLSNAGLESPNPGRNAVFLRYRRSF
jgi:hypothetical protein